jgi:hypothetical protein
MVLKSKSEARANFEAALAFIPSRYESGVRKADWFTPASSDDAEKNFATAMSDAIAKKKRQAGIKKLSNIAWLNAAVSKGAPVIGERIRAALGKWEAVWGPMYDKITSLVPTLPKRTLDYKANITNRLMKVVEEWKRASGKL